MFAARDIDIDTLPGIELESGSTFGRIFARIGGLSEAVVQGLKEANIKDFKLSSVACSGMKECIKALEALSNGTSKYNFIEGMACEGGCICGPESLNHNIAVGKSFVQSHARNAKLKTIKDSTDASGAVTAKPSHVQSSPTTATVMQSAQPTMKTKESFQKPIAQQMPFKGKTPVEVKPIPKPKVETPAAEAKKDAKPKAEDITKAKPNIEIAGPIQNEPLPAAKQKLTIVRGNEDSETAKITIAESNKKEDENQ